MKDIYLLEEYGSLYEDIEHGKCEKYTFKNELGEISYVFIKKPLLSSDKYYEIVTPYGYGGPIILNCVTNLEKQLVREFEADFSQYCDENNIVYEFVRFHPILENVQVFESIYHTEFRRRTLGTTIKNDFRETIEEEFSKSAKRNIKNNLSQGMEFRVIKAPRDYKVFQELYYQTMDRNKAHDIYYFDDKYFEKCMRLLSENILSVEIYFDSKVIAAGFYFLYEDFIHTHLSGTHKEYLQFHPAYLLKYATVKWASENGVKLIHYGGGITNQEDDPLFTFKKRFSKNTEFEYWVGHKIHNKEIYDLYK